MFGGPFVVEAVILAIAQANAPWRFQGKLCWVRSGMGSYTYRYSYIQQNLQVLILKILIAPKCRSQSKTKAELKQQFPTDTHRPPRGPNGRWHALCSLWLVSSLGIGYYKLHHSSRPGQLILQSFLSTLGFSVRSGE